MRVWLLGSLVVCVGRILQHAVANYKKRRTEYKQLQTSHRSRVPLKVAVADCESRWFLEDLKLAMTGDEEAMVRTGHMLMTGYGAQADTHKAAMWLRQAMAIQDYKEPGSAFAVLDLQDSAVPKLNSRHEPCGTSDHSLRSTASVAKSHKSAMGQRLATAATISQIPLASMSRRALSVVFPQPANPPAWAPEQQTVQHSTCTGDVDCEPASVCDAESGSENGCEDDSEASISGQLGGGGAGLLRRSRSLPHFACVAEVSGSLDTAPGHSRLGQLQGSELTAAATMRVAGHRAWSDVRSLSSCSLSPSQHTRGGCGVSGTAGGAHLEQWTFEAAVQANGCLAFAGH